MLRTSLLAATLTLAMATASQAGTLAPGGGSWRTSDCFKPNPTSTDRSEAMTLNQSIAAYDDYLTKLSEFYACISAEAERDQQRVRAGAEQVMREAEQEAIASRPFQRR